MSTEIIQQNKEVIQKLVLDGDLSKMNAEQKVQYYNQFCQSLGLNPLTQPFQLITFQGKQRMYATKDCTEQLRKINGVSITEITATELKGVYVVTAKARDKEGKTDASTGVVNIEGLKGDNLANALMKAETKAKRRVTLSICGLGILDESETDTLPNAVTEDITHEEVKPEPVKKLNGGLKRETKPIDELELEHWAQSIKECNNMDELLDLFNKNKGTINSEQKVRTMFTARRVQLETGKAVAHG
jgi:hypothetical protein